MVGSMVTVESQSEDPSHREVFVMGYNPDEPGVLQEWDTESDSKGSEAQREVCMIVYEPGGSGGSRVSGVDNDP